jgi:hypothetical protein
MTACGRFIVIGRTKSATETGAAHKASAKPAKKKRKAASKKDTARKRKKPGPEEVDREINTELWCSYHNKHCFTGRGNQCSSSCVLLKLT